MSTYSSITITPGFDDQPNNPATVRAIELLSNHIYNAMDRDDHDVLNSCIMVLLTDYLNEPHAIRLIEDILKDILSINETSTCDRFIAIQGLIKIADDLMAINCTIYSPVHNLIVETIVQHALKNMESDMALLQIINENEKESKSTMFRFLSDKGTLDNIDVNQKTLKQLMVMIVDNFVDDINKVIYCNENSETSDLIKNDADHERIQCVSAFVDNFSFKDIDEIFGGYLPMDKSLLQDGIDNVYDVLTPITKITVIGSVKALKIMIKLGTSRQILRELYNVAERYDCSQCTELLQTRLHSMVRSLQQVDPDDFKINGCIGGNGESEEDTDEDSDTEDDSYSESFSLMNNYVMHNIDPDLIDHTIKKLTSCIIL